MRLSIVANLGYVLLFLLQGCGPYHVAAPEYSRETPREPAARVWSSHGAAAQPADSAGQSFYTVKRGDTLYSIAWQHGIEVQQLAQLNGIQPPYTIHGGQRLVLRQSGPVAAAPVQQRGPIVARPLPAPQPSVQVRTPAPQPQPEIPPAVAIAPASVPATASIAPEFDGNWVWPTRGRVVRGFQQDSAGRKGISIGGNTGQPVLAAASGKVVYVGSGLVGYGRLIIIKHNESLLSAYGHNSQLLVEEGEQVSMGQTIAKMGNSGAAQTALYFEIRKDGKPVNPMQYLPRS
jgi:lipoprotein NlpD